MGRGFSSVFTCSTDKLPLYVLDELKLNGKDTVRIDDRIRNVEAAEKAGCYGIQFKNAAQRYSDIHSLD